MSTPGSADAYDAFADVYNQHWGSYSQNSIEALSVLLLPRIDVGARVLDLCCGAGHVTGALSERGIEIVGLDGSRQMLSHARSNAPGVPVVQADARAFGLRCCFDAVISTFDSLNHILTSSELDDVFASVRACLKQGGVFVFDLNTHEGYLRHWGGSSMITDRGYSVSTFSSYDPGRRVGVFRAEVWPLDVEEQTALTFELWQRHHSDRRVRKGLKAAGFHRVEAYGVEDGALVQGHIGHADRVFYVSE